VTSPHPAYAGEHPSTAATAEEPAVAHEKYLTTPPDTEAMPAGVPYIVGNEAAERFSFYGMKAILVVFMTEYLMGADGTRATMTEPTAKFWLHTFVVAAYFFPLIGALLSDWLLGKYRTILLLSVVYCLGHLALALDETRLGLAVGLSLIAVGTGAIKPCVSAHVGDQFGTRNSHRLPTVFGWFYLAINLGAFLSTLLTPILLNEEKFYATFGEGLRDVSWIAPGPGLAFGVPGVLMALATVVFWMGRHVFIHVPPRGEAFLREAFTGEGLSAILRLLPIYAFVAAFWCLFDQTASAWVLQAKQMDRRFLGIEWLSSQLQALNPLFILILVPTFAYVIYPLINHVFPLTPLRKIGLGMFLTIFAFSISGLIEMQIQGGRTVGYKLDASDEELESVSEFDAAFGVQQLLDEEETGWVSGKIDEEHPLPVNVVVRLRERRVWAIDEVRVDPRLDLEKYVERRSKSDAGFEPRPVDAYRVHEVEILTSDSPVGPWTSHGTLDLAGSDGPATLQIDDVGAEYVMIRVLRNGGGDAVGLGEVAVLSHDAAGRSINVAATGFRPNIGWQVFAYLLLTAAEVMVSITCLEFSYSQAPNSMKSVIMAIFLLSVAAGNEFTAVVNLLIERSDGTSRLPGASYYWFFTAVMAVASVGYVFVAMRYRGRTFIQGEDAPARTCRACGEPVPSDVTKCPACGASVAEADRARANADGSELG
jgi:proton-dependent oligopeptide transporter, POT family